MRKFQEFVESKSLKLQETHEPGHYDTDDDSDDYNLGMQQTGEERENKWDWLIDKSKSYQDALEKIRNLAKEYLSGVSRHPADRDIIRLVDEILPKTKETYSDQGVFRPKF